MSPHRLLLCALPLALLPSSCRKQSSSADAGQPVQAPAARVPPGPGGATAVDDFTLSLLEDAPAGGCRWVRLEGRTGVRREVASVQTPCARSRVAWSFDGQHAALLTPGEGEGPARAWTVELASGRVTPLPLPALGETEELGFDRSGTLTALVAHLGEALDAVEEGEMRYLLFDGRKYPYDVSEGQVGLAHAFRRTAVGWERVETVTTTYGWDYAAGTGALEAARQLGPTSGVSWGRRPDSEEVGEEEPVHAVLAPLTPEGEAGEGTWKGVRTAGGPLYYWEGGTEFASPHLPLRWRVEEALVEPEKLSLPAGTAVELRVRGDALLVEADRAVRLYDARRHRQVLSLEGAHQPAFWPQPSTPPALPPSPQGRGPG